MTVLPLIASDLYIAGSGKSTLMDEVIYRNLKKLKESPVATAAQCTRIEGVDKISDVVESKRLVGSPCSLVNPKDGLSSQMEKMMKKMSRGGMQKMLRGMPGGTLRPGF